MNTLALRRIDVAGYPAVSPPSSFGKPARLEWLAIRQLVIDPEYQREISAAGRKNVLKIAGEFDWARFAPVIVAPAGGGQYAIVDGQHRATAAALAGLDKVPCAVIDGERAAQAAAFAAINTAVTAMSPLQIHAARLAAGDERARRLTQACAEAGVTICRYPVPADKMKVGETLAAGKLYGMLARFGEETLVAALSCITRTRQGYAGYVRAQIVEALCAVLEAEPGWRDSRGLLKAMGAIDIAEAFRAARMEREGSRSGIVSALVDRFAEHLDKHLGSGT